jgi:coenzyme PQQ precursor peptide PqqA
MGAETHINNIDWRECAGSKIMRNTPMKIWNKPQVREQEVGLEVTSYLPAEIDII